MLETPFTCPNGHNFVANAKIRARCPNCGSMARRSFQQTTVEEPKPEEPKVVAPKPTVQKGPRLLRQGKIMPRTTPVKATPKPVVKPKPKPVVKAKSATVPKRPLPKVLPKTAGGLVVNKKATRGAVPSITKKPRKTAPARHVVGGGRKAGYMDTIMKNMGF